MRFLCVSVLSDYGAQILRPLLIDEERYAENTRDTPPRVFSRKSSDLLEKKRLEFFADAKEFARA